MKHVRWVILDLVSQLSGGGVEQLVYLVWERTTKRHTATEKAPGKNKLLTQTAPLKHVKNVTRLETSTRQGQQL